jgi:hypothetical protein
MRLPWLTWKQLNKRDNSDVIFNSNFVFRQFSSQLVRDGSEFTVLLVEKKHEAPDFFFSYQRYAPEILILEGGELIAAITDSIIERSELMKHADLVPSKSDRFQRLLGSSKASKLLDKILEADNSKAV